MMKKERRILPALAVLVFCTVLVYSFLPSGAEDVKKALELCAQRLVPSVFISTALSCYLVKSGLYAVLSKPFSPLVKGIFGLPAYCASPMITGFLCGFPNGAAAFSQLYKSGKLTKAEASCTAAFSSMPSLAFFAGFVGEGIFSSVYIGIALYLCTLLASVFTGSVLSALLKERTAEKAVTHERISLVKPLYAALSDAVTKTLSACSAVVFFSAVGGIPAKLPIKSRPLCAVISGFLELCGGISKLRYLPLEPCAVLCAALCGFSGISVFVQIYACTSDAGLEIPSYIIIKLAISALSAAYAAVLFFLPPVFSALTFALSCLAVYLLRKAFSGSLQTGISRQKRAARRI